MNLLNINTLPLLKDLVGSDLALAYTILLFISLNLLLTILNFWWQKKLKAQEVEIHSNKKKAEKKIAAAEKIFSEMQELRKFENKFENHQFTKKVTNTRKAIYQYELYLDKELSKLANDYCDFCTRILTNKRAQDYSKEDTYFKKYKNNFHK